MPFRTFAQAYDYLARVTDYERMAGGRYTTRAYNLRRMRRLLDALGNPERRFASVHIAGTKGKGSTAHIAEQLLRAHGLKTGLYTSPHLVHMRERIRLDGRPVTESLFVRTLNRMRGVMDRVRPTYFEIMTAAAFAIFAERHVDVAVVEVGMGGRLDATNVLHPKACAIARIDYDHTAHLGTRLHEIAGEKAGIIKPRVPVFTSETRPSALATLRRKAREVRSPLVEVAGKVRRVRATFPRGRPWLDFEWEDRRLAMPVLGAFQARNAALALCLAREVLGAPDPGKTARCLAEVRLPGRLEIVRERPLWILDVAHNPLAVREVAQSLRPIPRQRAIAVFGASADKNVAAMMRALEPQVDLWILTRADVPRACPPEELARRAPGPALLARRVADAVDLADQLAGPEDLVLVTGSFYVAGEATARWSGREREKRTPVSP